MNFDSQICTTEEQSKRLIALGLKRETAAMGLAGDIPIAIEDWKTQDTTLIDFPAWSLHRLIEMCNKTQVGMTIGIYNDEATVKSALFEVYDNTYDNLISIIEWLIGWGKFNKNYLNIH
jgi:hypothetical protein